MRIFRKTELVSTAKHGKNCGDLLCERKACLPSGRITRRMVRELKDSFNA